MGGHSSKPSVEQSRADKLSNLRFFVRKNMSNAHIEKDRRVTQVAIPENVKSILTDMQRQALARLEGFGWSLAFVRRPIFQDDVVVLYDPSGKRHAILNEDGSLDTNTDIAVR